MTTKCCKSDRPYPSLTSPPLLVVAGAHQPAPSSWWPWWWQVLNFRVLLTKLLAKHRFFAAVTHHLAVSVIGKKTMPSSGSAQQTGKRASAPSS